MDPRSADPRRRPRVSQKVVEKIKKELPQSSKVKKEVKQETSERVIELLNGASLDRKDTDKIEKLRQVQELIVHKDPQLLDNFFEEILAFQTSSSADIRKFLVGFMEEASKKDNELLIKVMAYMKYHLPDKNVAVIKKVIQSTTQLFRLTVKWVSTKIPNKNHKACWEVLLDLNNLIFDHLDSMNDGVRTQTIKYVEKVALTFSELRRDSEIPKKEEAMSSLDQIPPGHSILIKDEVKNIGKDAFEKLLAFVASPAISSVNLMAAMGTLTSIAKQRPQFMGTVVQAFESLHANLPPTLSKSQVTSVRKHLKMQLLNMLKHHSSIEYHPQMTNLLYDLGTNSNEIAKNMPKIVVKTESRKRSPDDEKENKTGKKPKKEELLADLEIEEVPKPSTSKDTTETSAPEESISAVDITANILAPLLTPANVANLVLLSMVMLPDKMPDAFHASYTPIESAGTEEQKLHLARLLSVQMTAMGIGPGVTKAEELRIKEEAKKRQMLEKEKLKQEQKSKQQILTVIGGTTNTKPKKEEEHQSKKQIDAIMSAQPVLSRSSLQRRIQGFKLESITQPLSIDDKDRFIKMAVMRILKAEKNTIISGVHNRWQKIITSLVAQFGGDLHRALANYIMEDVRSRSTLAFMWLYEEFNIFLENSRGDTDRIAQENYNACLTGLLQGLREKHDFRDDLFTSFVMQAPLLTDGAIKQIQSYCDDDDVERSKHGLSLVKDLVTLRPTKKNQFLRVLLDLSTSAKEGTRNESIECIMQIQTDETMEEFIRQYACTNLQFLVRDKPPSDLLADDANIEEAKWTENLMKQCMSLFLALLPLQHELIHQLADVYTKSNADIKRIVLRVLDQPVLGMGMASPNLLELVETCPKGAETLVTRMLHILTDKTPPSKDLVKKVCDLYVKRVPDVRFLIPVLTGLNKADIIEALPKLIRLNPPVVKGVFNRLLNAYRMESEHTPDALSPVELLVALHNIEPEKADVKSVIKATSLCFSDRMVYTSEVLVTVINRLVEQSTIPTLFMRTVLQSLITYPRLSGFIMNILQRLIHKKVWLQEKVWEGFIRCCQRMKPQSFQVLLQLPADQLSSVFVTAPELREPLLAHINRFTPQQRQHVDNKILKLLGDQPDTPQTIFPANTAKVESQGNANTAFPVASSSAESTREDENSANVKKEQTEIPMPVYTTMAPYTILPPGMSLPLIQSMSIPPPGLVIPNVPPQNPQPSEQGVKREMRSPTPTQDEADDGSESPPRKVKRKDD